MSVLLSYMSLQNSVLVCEKVVLQRGDTACVGNYVIYLQGDTICIGQISEILAVDASKRLIGVLVARCSVHDGDAPDYLPRCTPQISPEGLRVHNLVLFTVSHSLSVAINRLLTVIY